MISTISSPIELRAHHLDWIKKVRTASIEEIRKMLIDWGIKDSQDSFVDFSYELGTLLDAPREFKLVEGGADHVCRACSNYDGEISTCKHPSQIAIQKREKPILGAAFEPVTKDMQIANKYGLQIGQTYTSQQLRGKLGL